MDISTWLYDEMEAAGVFEGNDHERLFDKTNYYKLIKDFFQRAGVSGDDTFHTLRAANATERDTAGQDRESIHAGLGWAKDSNVPEKHYLRHQDYYVIEKGSSYNDRLQGYGNCTLKERPKWTISSTRIALNNLNALPWSR